MFNLVDRLIEVFLSRLEVRVIFRRDSEPYLVRYYLLHNNRFKFLPGIYIHQFLSSDEDLELHNHPWRYSFSLILSGSYLEEWRDSNNKVRTKVYSSGSINFIRANDFHRVDLQTPCVWTLFVSGKKEQNWGFWDRETGEYVPHEEHVSKNAS